jgi:hypothetical protein
MIHTQIGHAKSPPGTRPFGEDTNLATSLLGRSSVSKESVAIGHFLQAGTRSVESSYAVIWISDSGQRSGKRLVPGACSWNNLSSRGHRLNSCQRLNNALFGRFRDRNQGQSRNAAAIASLVHYKLDARNRMF